MRVFRISKCSYIQDLSGTGAALFGGRWNSKGKYLLYTSGAASLALLETIVHLSKIPAIDFCLLEIDIPSTSVHEINAAQLPEKWQVYPSPAALKKMGDAFIKKEEKLVMKVPSAIIPGEYNYLLNPNHTGFKKVQIIGLKKISLDARLKA